VRFLSAPRIFVTINHTPRSFGAKLSDFRAWVTMATQPLSNTAVKHIPVRASGDLMNNY